MSSQESSSEQGSAHRGADSPPESPTSGEPPDAPPAAPRVGGDAPTPSEPAPAEVHVNVTPAVKVRVTCPHCQQGYKVAEDLVGKAVRCLKCRETFNVTEDVSFWRAAVEEAKTRYGNYDPSKESARARSVRRGVDED